MSSIKYELPPQATGIIQRAAERLDLRWMRRDEVLEVYLPEAPLAAAGMALRLAEETASDPGWPEALREVSAAANAT